MTLQICPNCRRLGCTWYMTGDDGAEQTFWRCSECEFEIEEDESRECYCLACNTPWPNVSWLFNDSEGYYWCFTCNDRTENTKPFDKEKFSRQFLGNP